VLEFSARPGQQLSAAEIDEIAKATFSFDHGIHHTHADRTSAPGRGQEQKAAS
jgi:hypothetical protein